MAISDSANDSFKVSNIYKNAIIGINYAKKNNEQIVFYQDIFCKMGANTSSNSLETVLNLNLQISDFNLGHAEDKIVNLFEQMDEQKLPDFFVLYITINITNSILKILVEMNIKYDLIMAKHLEIMSICNQLNVLKNKSVLIQLLSDICMIINHQYTKEVETKNKMTDYLKEHYADIDFSVNSMAEKFKISSAYLSHIFKEKVGFNISNYIWNLRINKAKQLLEETDIPIKQIIIQIGFYSPSSFTRKFKEKFNMTPSEYRQQCMKKNKERINND